MLSHTLWFNADPQGGLLYQTKNSFKGQDYFSTGRSCPFFPHNEIWYYLKHPLGKVNVVSFLTFSSVFIFAEVYTSPSSRPLFWLKKSLTHDMAALAWWWWLWNEEKTTRTTKGGFEIVRAFPKKVIWQLELLQWTFFVTRFCSP